VISWKRRSTSGGFATLLDQRALIDAVLSVANLRAAPDDPDLIYRPLDAFAAPQGIKRLTEQGRAAGALLWRDFTGWPDHEGLWRVGAIRVLDRICEKLPDARRDFSGPVGDALRTSRAALVAVPELRGDRIHAPLRVQGFGAQAVVAIALALLLDRTALIDKSRSYGDALRRCKYPVCRKFFLSFTGRVGGRPPEYHEGECKRLHNKSQRALR
jgi:hypothetical protein